MSTAATAAVAAAVPRDALMPRQPPGRGLGFVLAVLAHLLLVLALAFSVNWRAREPQGVEAELWSAVPQAAAPAPAAVTPVAAAPEPPTPPVARPPVPQPQPQPQPRRPEPVARPQPAPQTAPDPQIAIEKAKREVAQRDEEQRRRDARREQLRREQDKLAEQQQQQRREEAERQKLEARRQQERKQQAAEKERIENDRLATDREANLKRMLGQAASSSTGAANATSTTTAAAGAPTATGTAARSSGPSAGYAGRIRARIKPNIVFNEPVGGNPLASVEVRLAPDGTIVGKRLVKSSGVKAWDDAVLRAVERTAILPTDVDGRVPPPFLIDFRPFD